MTQVSSAQFKNLTASLYADNTSGEIGANDLRTQMNNLADSTVFKTTGKTSNPQTTDDGNNTSGNGVFQIGDVWVNETANRAFICVDNATNTSIWTEITYTEASTLSATASPSLRELAVWASETVLQGFPELKWNEGINRLELIGDFSVTGTVDGRDVAVDGAKLDLIPATAIEKITTVNTNVDGSTVSYDTTILDVVTGDGLAVTNPSAGVARLEIRNNDITVDTANRTLASTDNFSFITNAGAVGTVRWTLPLTNTLQSTPRLVAIFFKTANQTMEIVGASAVTVNGLTEAGGAESLITICPTPYTSLAYVFYGGAVNTYYVVQGSSVNSSGTPADNQLAVWTSSGRIEGNADLTWNSTTLAVAGEVTKLQGFNLEVATPHLLDLTDHGRLLLMSNASPNIVTIQAEIDQEFPVGADIRIMQVGVGVTTIEAAPGVTLNGVVAGSGNITAQWKQARLYKIAADQWYVVEDIGTVS